MDLIECHFTADIDPAGNREISVFEMPAVIVGCGFALSGRRRALEWNSNAWRVVSTFAVALMLLTSCAPKEAKVLIQSSEALGPVLAEETARAAGAKKRVAIITPANWGPTSSAEETFTAALKKQGFSPFIVKSADLGDPMRRGQVGLKPADFLDALQNATDAGAVVSFAGAPLVTPADMARLGAAHPPMLVVATASLGKAQGVWADAMRLGQLLDARIIQMAFIDGGPESAAEPSGKADATHQLFAQNYRILRSPN